MRWLIFLLCVWACAGDPFQGSSLDVDGGRAGVSSIGTGEAASSGSAGDASGSVAGGVTSTGGSGATLPDAGDGGEPGTDIGTAGNGAAPWPTNGGQAGSAEPGAEGGAPASLCTSLPAWEAGRSFGAPTPRVTYQGSVWDAPEEPETCEAECPPEGARASWCELSEWVYTYGGPC